MFRGVAAALVAAGLMGGPALAEVSDFLGNWLNAASGQSGFLGNLIGTGSGDSEIARIVTTPAGANAVRIHLYGRCDRECDWGTAIGHNRSAAPNSDDVESISADFNTGQSAKHLTLRKGPGGTLHFSIATDFTDHSGRHDYEVSGSLRRAPVAPMAQTSAPVAAAAPSTTPPAVAANAAAVSAPEFSEDCEKINPEDVFVAPSNRGWALRDYNHVILDYGSDKPAAARAERVMTYYHFDEQCYVVRPKPKMIYWRVAGQFPRDPMPGEDCVDLHAVAAKGDKVMDGDRVVIDFAGDAHAAAQAASVIRTYRVNRQCFVARPNDKMVYWLSK